MTPTGLPADRLQPGRVAAAVDVAAAALEAGVVAIAETHAAVARKPFAALERIPVTAPTTAAVRLLHDGVSTVVYTGVRAGIRLAGLAGRVAGAAAGVGERGATAGSAADLALSALNGFSGDRLEAAGSPLADRMTLRHGGCALPIDRAALRAAFPCPPPRLVLFVHGLACNETLWWRGSEQHYGDAQTSYGTRLQRDLGYSALYLRYNTGLPIAENGRRLSALLERLLSEWPVPVTELTLVGHSMGGLVIRSAAAAAGECDWTRQVRHCVYLGSPHLGAPLEKAANVVGWLLGLTDVTRPLARLVNQRSRGIKDLRFGTLREDDWQGVDVDGPLAGATSELPLLPGAAHYFVSATVTRDPAHPLGLVVGDLLVREASATRRSRRHRQTFALDNGRHFGAMSHLALLNHPDVYDQLRAWLQR